MSKHLIRTSRSVVLAALLAIPLTLPSAAAVAGETAKPSPATGPAVKGTKGEMTVEQHLAKMKEYKGKAAAYRAEAAAHHKMLEKTIQENVTEGGEENIYITKMKAHCSGFIDKAEALATEAEKFADFHRMRAAELKGQ